MAPTPRQDSIDRFLEMALDLFPDLDPEAEAAVDRITKIHKYLARVTERTVSRYGLNTGEFKVLLKLRQAPQEQLSAGTLSEYLTLSSGAMTNRLDGLEEAGLIVRERDAADRRSVLVRLTDAGIDVLARTVDEQAVIEAELIGVLKPEEQRRLNDLLRRIVLAIEDERAAERNPERATA
jgi:DNA-binding MarR family transcriptional regulator